MLTSVFRTLVKDIKKKKFHWDLMFSNKFLPFLVSLISVLVSMTHKIKIGGYCSRWYRLELGTVSLIKRFSCMIVVVSTQLCKSLMSLTLTTKFIF